MVRRTEKIEMSKKKTGFVCASCGEEYSRWQGRCESCGEWNAISANTPARGVDARKAEIIPLSGVLSEGLSRTMTDMAEFNLVCGGGIVPGSVILIGGEPGIGKSTLALQIAGSLRALYISGEESPAQLRSRAERIGADVGKIFVSSNTGVDEILELIGANKPECVIVDSIQTVHQAGVPGVTGSISQIREATSRFVDAAKRLSIPIVLIGHITKEGSIAGPKMLEHLVDTVLYFEGDFSKDYRILRAFKNRFGSVNEIGLFRMSDRGLMEIKDKNSVFLNPYPSSLPGNAVSAAIEGSRIILFEVQSLVSFTSFSNPRRMSDGFDLNRLILINAVLEKYASLKLSAFDVFINVAGGFSITETASDLAVAMSISSSLKNKPIPRQTGLIGEISLSGEIRPVMQCVKRMQEFARAGITSVILPKNNCTEAAQSGFKGDIVGVETIAEAVNMLF
jgi:DNA repair protein RadA/Sms